MAKNPLFAKKFQEGYNKGFMAGKDAGIAVAVDFVAQKFAELQDMPGVGPKTIEKFRDAFGPEYFKRVD